MTTYDVKEIGYAFLRTYYERMHNDPSKLSSLYASTAELTHVNYNEPIKHDKDYLQTVKLIGKDNINNFYTRNSKRVQDLKVKIDSCDFQSTGFESTGILVLTLGELCWTGSPSYRFCQCFILEPAEYNSKIYDLKNDIIRFIPDLIPLTDSSLKIEENIAKQAGNASDISGTDRDEKTSTLAVLSNDTIFKEESASVTVPTVKVPVEAPVSSARDTEYNSNTVEISEAVAAPNKVTAEVKENDTEDASPKMMQTEEHSPLPSSKTSSTKRESSAEETPQLTPTSSSSPSSPPISSGSVQMTDTQATSEKESHVKPEPVKMTWAGKLNKTSKLNTNYIKVDVPTKKAKSPPPNGFIKSSKKNKQQSKQIGEVIIQNSSGFYPVYVGNTNGLTALELEKALIKEYGDVVKTSFQDSFAVVDFRERSARDAAIESQHLKVGEKVINLNPKGDKSSKHKSKNNANNNNNSNSNTIANGNGSFTQTSSHSSPSPSLEGPGNQNHTSFKRTNLKLRNDKSKN